MEAAEEEKDLSFCYSDILHFLCVCVCLSLSLSLSLSLLSLSLSLSLSLINKVTTCPRGKIGAHTPVVFSCYNWYFLILTLSLLHIIVFYSIFAD